MFSGSDNPRVYVATGTVLQLAYWLHPLAVGSGFCCDDSAKTAADTQGVGRTGNCMCKRVNLFAHYTSALCF